MGKFYLPGICSILRPPPPSILPESPGHRMVIMDIQSASSRKRPKNPWHVDCTFQQRHNVTSCQIKIYLLISFYFSCIYINSLSSVKILVHASSIVHDVKKWQSTTKNSSTPLTEERTSEVQNLNLHGNHQSTALEKPIVFGTFFCTN